jgi:hypothetical protein
MCNGADRRYIIQHPSRKIIDPEADQETGREGDLCNQVDRVEGRERRLHVVIAERTQLDLLARLKRRKTYNSDENTV